MKVDSAISRLVLNPVARWINGVSAVCALGHLSVPAADTRGITYEADIRPIFKAHCFQCDGEEGVTKGGVDLRFHRLILKGGEEGPVIQPGDRHKSRLFELVKSGDMPKKAKPLGQKEVELIGRWIDARVPVSRPEPADLNSDD